MQDISLFSPGRRPRICRTSHSFHLEGDQELADADLDLEIDLELGLTLPLGLLE